MFSLALAIKLYFLFQNIKTFNTISTNVIINENLVTEQSKMQNDYDKQSISELIISNSLNPTSSSATGRINVKISNNSDNHQIKSADDADQKYKEYINNYLKTKQKEFVNPKIKPLTYDSLKYTSKYPLENVFRIPVYRLNINSSSPCNYTGKERVSKCHKTYVFDYELYNSTIEETRRLILTRIGLNKAPNTNINRKTVRLLNGIHRNFDSKNSKFNPTPHTSLDMQGINSKTIKSIREITGIYLFTINKQHPILQYKHS